MKPPGRLQARWGFADVKDDSTLSLVLCFFALWEEKAGVVSPPKPTVTLQPTGCIISMM